MFSPGDPPAVSLSGTLTRPAAAEGALRARALGLLFVGGATIGLVGVASSSSLQVDRSTLAILAVLGYPTGLALFLWGRRWPSWTTQVVLVGGTVLTGAGIYVTHGTGLGVSAAFFYVWVAMFAFHFFRLRVAIVQLGLAGATYGAVEGVDGGSGAVAEWMVAMGTATVAGIVMALVSRELRHAATTDHLTGLPNRQVLDHVLRIEMARASREDSPLAVAIIDVDGFKAVNDNLGHAAGDAVLVDQARAWRRLLRGSDTLIRYGGDEFVIVLPGARLAEADEVISRCTSAGPVPASAGLVVFEPGDDPDSILRRADENLYEAKHSKANQSAAELSKPLHS